MDNEVKITYCPPAAAEGAYDRYCETARGSEMGGHYVMPIESMSVPNELRAMQALWDAVLMQMVIDLKSQSKKKASIVCRERARQWFEWFEDDFRMVCELAGRHPEKTRAQLERARERGFLWRKESVKMGEQYDLWRHTRLEVH